MSSRPIAPWYAGLGLVGLAGTLLAGAISMLAVAAVAALAYWGGASGRERVRRYALRFGLFGIALALVCLAVPSSSLTHQMIFVLARIGVAGCWTLTAVATVDVEVAWRYGIDSEWCRPLVELLDASVLQAQLLMRQLTRLRTAAEVRGAVVRGPRAVATFARVLGRGANSTLEASIRREQSRWLRSQGQTKAASSTEVEEAPPAVSAECPAIDCDAIEVSRGNTTVLRDFSLSIPRGDWVAVVGPSASGKTTLLHTLAGLLEPDAGGMRRFGDPATGPRADIGLVFQNPDCQFLGRTPIGDLAWGLRQYGVGSDEARQQARRQLEMLDIGDLAERPLYELSFGQQRLVALAGALVTQPDMLLCDELTSGLDPISSRRVVDAIRQCCGDDVTVIWATHRLWSLPSLVDRVAIVNNGSILVDESPQAALQPDVLRRAGLLGRRPTPIPDHLNVHSQVEFNEENRQ